MGELKPHISAVCEIFKKKSRDCVHFLIHSTDRAEGQTALESGYRERAAGDPANFRPSRRQRCRLLAACCGNRRA